MGRHGQHQGLGVHAEVGRLTQAEGFRQEQEGHVGRIEECEVAHELDVAARLVFPGDVDRVVECLCRAMLPLPVHALVLAVVGKVHAQLAGHETLRHL